MGSHDSGGTAGTVFRKVGAFAKVCGWAWRPVAVKCRPSRLAAGATTSDLGRSDSEKRQQLVGTFNSRPGVMLDARSFHSSRNLARDAQLISRSSACEVDANDVGGSVIPHVGDIGAICRLCSVVHELR